MIATDVCSVCKKRGVAKGYSLTKLFHLEDNTQLRNITKWCNECLTEYADTIATGYRHYTPKLRDTNIKKYNDTYPEVTHFEHYHKM